MLAAAGPLPDGPGWAFEFKYDGVRAITYLRDGSVRVFSRNGNDITATYPELGEVRERLVGRSAIIDGEVVALAAGDRPSFARLQSRMHVAAPTAALLHSIPVRYYVFDLLDLDGESLLELPYERRRELLAGLDLAGDAVRVPTAFTEVHGPAVLHTAELAGFEGVVAKRLSAPYRAGKRSADWTKVPLIRTQEVLIVGYELGEGRRAGTLGALLLGVRDEHDQLRYAGQVGTGFTDAMLHHLYEQLAVRRRSSPPVPDVPRDHARKARWVEPDMVGEVAYRTWTADGRLRHASWRGLRPDQPVTAARRVAAPPPVVTGALATADGRWNVEVVRRDGYQSYRIRHAGSVLEELGLADVERILRAAGVSLADLRESTGDRPAAASA
jgi:bifunctional non-homologous end joining protein LigD